VKPATAASVISGLLADVKRVSLNGCAVIAFRAIHVSCAIAISYRLAVQIHEIAPFFNGDLLIIAQDAGRPCNLPTLPRVPSLITITRVF
jgi:hypothetical protein